jgi:hypothetical protein
VGTYRKTPTRAAHPRGIILAISGPGGDRSRCRCRGRGSSGVGSAEGDCRGSVSSQRAQAVVCCAGAFDQFGGWGLRGCGGCGWDKEGESEGEEGGDHFGGIAGVGVGV